jgi:predicted MFS family arabinose efflux permease
MAVPAPDATSGRRRVWDLSNRRLVTMCVLTLVGVTGHFISYTFIVVIIRDIVGVGGPNLALLLAAYGIAGLTAMGLLARPGDRRPKAAIVGCLAGLTLVFALLAGLGFAGRSTAATLLIGIVAVVAWGATATAVPPMLQSAAMRHCPEDPDGASGLYVAAFQIGIMAGSLVGGLLFERTGEAVMLAASGLLVAGALTCVLLSRDLFAVEGVTSRE